MRCKKPVCDRVAKATYAIDGLVGAYVDGLVDQWLLVAPRANPAMLEMFHDRDASKVRDQVPWAGEFAGKYLTGAVEVWRLTGDLRLGNWLKEFVTRLVDCQDRDGYLGPWPRDCRLTNFTPHQGKNGRRTWDTWGHYHIMMGLLAWHEQTADDRGMSCVKKIADLICRKYLGPEKPDLVGTGCPEMNLAPVHALCVLYRRTSMKRYLDMALQIVSEFGGKDHDNKPAGDYFRLALAGKAFYETQRPRWESLHPIMGLAELYWITGDDEYRRAFEQIWWSIAEHDRHNGGGFSSGERATGNPYHPGAIETCCTIAWMALSIEMLRMTGDSVVADEIELSTLNSVVGMHSHTGRWATYNTPMDGVRRASGHDIVFQARPGSPELNCCSVNSPRGFGLVSDWALMFGRDGLVLNYYGPSRMRAKLRPGLSVELVQETGYPLSGEITIRVDPSKPAPFVLMLRVPHWSRRTRASINGRSLARPDSGRYLRLERAWQKGDTIRLRLDMSLHFWRGEQDCQGLTSVYRGPLLLAFDHRHNRHLSTLRKSKANPTADPGALSHIPAMPTLDLRALRPKNVRWVDWIAPALLLAVKTADGRTARLCDYGSAGEGGTPYRSWLKIRGAPPKAPFSRTNPLRSARFEDGK